MLEIAILKNFDSGTYKAGVQLAGSLTTYFDDISVAKNIPSSALVIGNYVILAIPGGNPKDACVIATWPGGSPGAVTKLDDIGDVNVPSPSDGHVPYYDAATGLWKCKAIDKTNLSQDFGPSGARLRNIIPAPLSGRIFRIQHSEGSCFSGLIDDNAGAHGGQGLDSTHVPYDGETREDMFEGLDAYDGSSYWGQIILHNTMRGNSRKIVSVDRTNNVIVTSESDDDWADNDVITTESQTNGGIGNFEFFDIDLSAKIGMGVNAIFLFMVLVNQTANYSSVNSLLVHPYESYDSGKAVWLAADLANQDAQLVTFINVIDRKITVCIGHEGTDDLYAMMLVLGTIEFADT